jgi:hypothetical protein
MRIISLFIYLDSLTILRLNNVAFLTTKITEHSMRHTGDYEWSASKQLIVIYLKMYYSGIHLQKLRKSQKTSVSITGNPSKNQTTHRLFKTSPLHLSIVQVYWNHYVSEFGSTSIFCPWFESLSTKGPKREGFLSYPIHPKTETDSISKTW